jgi:pimeloyl-ACP methyl ester carboxylesterase
VFQGVAAGRRPEGWTADGWDEAVNVAVSDDVVRRAIGPEAGRVSYLTAGTQLGRETVLLIHGAGVSARSWMPQLQGLAGTLGVLALDLPGHGDSAPIWKPSVEGYAETAYRLLAVLGTGPVWVAGHSLGGAVALALAARHPDRVKGLVLISSCTRLPETTTPLQRLIWHLLPTPVRTFLFLLTVRKVLFAPGAPPQAVALGMEELHACRRETLITDAMVAQAMRLEETARSLRAPTLILCGSLDRFTPPELSAQLARLIPGAQLDIIERAGHMLPLEKPDELNRKILDFVASGLPTGRPPVPRGRSSVRPMLRGILAKARAAFRSLPRVGTVEREGSDPSTQRETR